MTVTNDIKARENLLRARARKRWMTLKKSTQRDQGALDYGLFALLDNRTNAYVNPSLHGGLSAYSWTLEQAEEHFGVGKPTKKAARR